MPPGEEMFKYHGYSGGCPKPPLPRPQQVMIGYSFRDAEDGFWLDIDVDRQPYTQQHFDTASERQRAYDDLLGMMRSMGAADLPRAQ
jgi:hypothetical protein